MSFQEILEQVKDMPQKEQETLYQVLEVLLSEKKKKQVYSDEQFHTKKPYSLLDFRGVAKHIADDEDPQDYINRLRDEWDREL